jgi:hypothetical protein
MSEMSPSIVDLVEEPSHGNAMQNAKKMPPAHATTDHDCTSDSDDDDGQDVSTKTADEVKVTKDVDAVADEGQCIRCGRGFMEVLSDSLQCSGCGTAFHLACLREGTVDFMLSFNYA